MIHDSKSIKVSAADVLRLQNRFEAAYAACVARKTALLAAKTSDARKHEIKGFIDDAVSCVNFSDALV